MTIRIFTSSIGGEPLETHEHKATSLSDWFREKVPDYDQKTEHFWVRVDGVPVARAEWPLTFIKPGSDVEILPYPQGGIGKIFGSVFKLIGSLLGVNASAAGYSSPATGDSLDTSGTAKANTANLGDPIREVFGKQQIYPDYLVSPVSRFSANDPETFYTNMFICLGRGYFDFASGDLRIGATPVDSFGDNVTWSKYDPGADVSADERTEMWFVSGEVGSTTAGSGLDMGTTAPTSTEVVADSVTVAGTSIAFNGLDSADDDDSDADDNKFPDSWAVGALLTISVPTDFTVTTAGTYSRLSSNDLLEINPYVGMPVTLTYNSISYDLWISAYSGPDSSTGAEAWVELAYTSATGTAFAGVPTGSQRVGIGHQGLEYKIVTEDAPSLSVVRMVDGAEDDTWPGFDSRTALDFSVTGINDSDLWLGPFLACPESETVDLFECNFSFPNGLIDYGNSGNKEWRTAAYEIQYREYGTSAGWQSVTGSYTNKNANGLGYTVRVTLSASALVEVRVRRTNNQGDGNSRDTMYWQALQSRLTGAPTQYDGVTSLAMYIVLGGKLAAQSDRKVNVIATRRYTTGTARTVSGALQHVIDTVGLPNVDTAGIADLETSYWTPNGITFDFASTEDSTTINDMMTTIASAARGYFTLKDGTGIIGLDINKPFSRLVLGREMTDYLQTSVTMPSDDDYDGVDVTFTSAQTWQSETIQCRIPGADTAKKVQTVNADGILTADKAYQFGMRILMRAQKQRLNYSYTTELSALSYGYGDRVVITEDVPGNYMVSSFMESCTFDGTNSAITVADPLDWTASNPRVIIGNQDGSVSALLTPTKTGDFSFTVPGDFSFSASAILQPPRVLFCDSTTAGYDMIVSEIDPGTDGTCDVTGIEYREDINQYDNTAYPGDTD